MNITQIKRSPYSNFTKSKMFRDYYDSFDDCEHNTEVYHYYRCYQALAIIEILARECQRIDQKAAKNMGLFRHSYFTAWIGKDLIFQWDDTNADEFLKNPEQFLCCAEVTLTRVELSS